MTFINGLSKIFPGFGMPQLSPGQSGVVANTALTSGSNTITVPATGSFSPTISAGKVRVKVYNGIGTAPVFTDLTITCTDGTTTVLIAAFHPNASVALSTTSWVDLESDFLVDINCTAFTIKITIAGTSPGATADVEVLGTI